MTKHKFAPIIHTFKSAEAGIMVNGYLIETSDHIVAVDSALIESAARELRKQFDSLGKPLAFTHYPRPPRPLQWPYSVNSRHERRHHFDTRNGSGDPRIRPREGKTMERCFRGGMAQEENFSEPSP